MVGLGWLAGWLAGYLAGRLSGWLAGYLAGWLSGWLAGNCLAGSLVEWGDEGGTESSWLIKPFVATGPR